MAIARRKPDPDGITTAQLAGTVGRYVSQKPLDVEAAVTELTRLTEWIIEGAGASGTDPVDEGHRKIPASLTPPGRAGNRLRVPADYDAMCCWRHLLRWTLRIIHPILRI
jgi:hypothetical protein